MNQTPTPEETPPDPPIVLEDTFRSALIGHTVSNDTPRFVYSINSIARIVSQQDNESMDYARKNVWAFVQKLIEDHGDRAPVFVDDHISSINPIKLPRSKSRIILPGRFGLGN